MCRILTHKYRSAPKEPLQISHPEITRQAFVLLELPLIGNDSGSKVTDLWRKSDKASCLNLIDYLCCGEITVLKMSYFNTSY